MSKNKKKNFIWNTIGITFNAFNSLFFLVIVNRINGIEEAGIFSYTYSLACLFYIIALYYNRTYQVADVENEYSNNQYITNRLITSILTLLIVVIFSIISGFSMFKMEILMLILIFRILEAVSDCFHGFIQKKDELYYVGQSLFLKAIIGLILFFITDYATNSIILSLMLLIITNIIGLIVDIKKYKSLYHQKFSFVFDKSISLFKIAFPVFIFSFLTIYLNNCQKYVMEYILDEKYQTVLGIIIMPATMLSLCGQYLINPYINELSCDYYNKEYEKFKKTVYKIGLGFFLLGIIILILAFLLGIPILNIVYSIDLNSYKNAFLIIIVGAILYALGNIISNCLTILRKNKEQLYIYIISSIFSTIISCFLIQKYEIEGASYAYIITMLVHFLLSYILLKTCLNKKIRSNL